MGRSKLIRLAALGVLALALPACYSYTALPAAGARVGQRVRVRVSGAEAERLEPVLGETGRAIEGDLVEQADTSIALAVPLHPVVEGAGIAQQPAQRIVIPRTDLQGMELRRLDKLRTSLLVGAGVAAVAAIALSKSSSLLGSGGSGGSPNERRVPSPHLLFKWRLTVP